MFTMHVHIKVKPNEISAFKNASLENARASILEAGIIEFDVIQSQEDPTQFILLEVYINEKAQAEHKETPHFKKWVAEVENMTEEPRKAIKYSILSARP